MYIADWWFGSFYFSIYSCVCVHIWSYIWVNYNDLTDLPHWSPSLEIMVNKRNHPQMAARFRLVKYYNLPIYHIYIYRLVNHPLVEKSPDRVSVASDVECWIPRSSQTDQAPWPMAHYYNTQSCGVKQCHEPAIWDWFIPPLKLGGGCCERQNLSLKLPFYTTHHACC